jgi:hypothetical protein
MEDLQIDLNRLGEWAFENEMIVNAGKSKAVCFTKVPSDGVTKLFIRRHSNP